MSIFTEISHLTVEPGNAFLTKVNGITPQEQSQITNRHGQKFGGEKPYLLKKSPELRHHYWICIKKQRTPHPFRAGHLVQRQVRCLELVNQLHERLIGRAQEK